MASKRSLVSRNGHLRLLTGPKPPVLSSVCPFCSLSPASRAAKTRSRPGLKSQRWQSTSTAAVHASSNARNELEKTLLELQKKIPGLVNLSRLQLALQGLRQVPGQEAIRVAILGVANGSEGIDAARKVLKALIVDPLVDEQDWEKRLDEHDTTRPLIIRVGPSQGQVTRLESSKENLPDVLEVSSAELNGLNLELLLMDVEVPVNGSGLATVQSLEEAVLVPTVATDEHATSMITPVHQALLVADGLIGAVGISGLPVLDCGDAITAAVNLKGFSKEQLGANFTVIDTSLAEEAINLFRQGPQNAMAYEHRWSASNLGLLVAWLKAGLKAADDEATKPAVRKLIASVLQGALSAIETESTSRKMSRELSHAMINPEMRVMNERLSKWAQNAHTELQEQLDLAFSGRRWKKLGWWKLFWRVDDVAMLTNEILSQRFLPTSEQELVYLTGRIAQLQGEAGQYSQPVSSREIVSESSSARSAKNEPVIPIAPRSHLPKWPGHIAFTRRYIQNETVPALQSLAQRLVIQSIGTSSVTSCLAALLYVSSFSSTIFEAGAVAALGVVYSLGRMQKKWETAREFWEGEVREEGRKAIRAAEESAGEVLDGVQQDKLSAQRIKELEHASELVAKAEDALARLK
ncbi:uncharacterized protein TRIVIDRAFT_176372 [Trichoderma virens Gv29-8]|uniref:Mmc1 C-terminal domain-containing protein n=1 Tax=Hypocrea virens (strain Gv29-8 / FGSC 10586) TaxID=413071 RepID=G9MH35_HYPVG|nr:uncharacterized protein TRIVIDRAFT_176372 [Trichoderma virens Gv29-8]EHK26026.1 hypothetical protein TRIVIDRAFT_176372 [Trichoderma virens Gv29-8]UKZ46209.1 hypothetical protein TrVGV298_000409 [Trichoderma virens]